MSYTIESNIPVPPSKRKTKYPFAEMKVGDSFFVPETESDTKRVGMAAHCFARELFLKKADQPRRKFTTKTQHSPAGTRCWRIA